MTHRYTILLGGSVFSGGEAPVASAIAWADDTVIGLGDDEAIRALSRGDSLVVELGGASVLPLSADGAAWPVDATLEVGGRADLVIVEADPRVANAPPDGHLQSIAVVRGGRVVAGTLPGRGNGSHRDLDGGPHPGHR